MKNDEMFTVHIKRSHMLWTIYISVAVFVLALSAWVFTTELNVHAAQDKKIAELQKEVDECRAEATAWYNSSTALSEEIVFASLKGLMAEKINTDIATHFAVEGHALKCIQPKFPTG